MGWLKFIKYSTKKFYFVKKKGLATNCDIDDNWEPLNGTCIKIFQTALDFKSSRL